MRDWSKMALLLIVTVFLTRFIPFSSFFRNVDTLVHELSHALVALLLSGHVRAIYLYADQSGVTYTSYADNWMTLPISLAGYIGAALFALLLFRLHASGRTRGALITVTVLAAAALALFVRNGYGMAWCAGFAIVTALIVAIGPYWLRYGYFLLIAFICLVESVVSPLELLYIALTHPSGAGDAANLSRYSHVPAIFWSLVFIAVSLWCAKVSTMLLLKHGFGAKRQGR